MVFKNSIFLPRGQKKRMAQIACKLPSKAKSRTVNCGLGHSFLAPMDEMQFFFLSEEKTTWGKKSVFDPLGRKSILRHTARKIENGFASARLRLGG